MRKLRLVCISDTHTLHRAISIPKCDLLIHAGDLTDRGKPQEIADFRDWGFDLIQQGIVQQVIVIAGNHDFLFQTEPWRAASLLHPLIYLQDAATDYSFLKLYGTPWQPWFYDWAFNLKTEQQLKEKFDFIPENTNILICHSPPHGILDQNESGEHCGSTALAKRITETKPKVVVFGHIHESYGTWRHSESLFINASSCTIEYKATNLPVVVDIYDDGRSEIVKQVDWA